MSRIQFSMASLMAVVAVFAATFAALRSDSQIWSKALFTAVVLVLLLAIPCAIYANQMRRAFWIGFIVVGWVYSILAFGSSLMSQKLLGSELANYLAPKLQQTTTVVYSVATPGGMGTAMTGSPGMMAGMPAMGGGGMGSMGMGGVTGTIIIGPSSEQIATVFDCWLTIIFAIAAGWIARYVAKN